MMLLAELHRESFSSQLHVDSLASVLAVHLLRQHGTTRLLQLPSYDGGLRLALGTLFIPRPLHAVVMRR